MKNLFGKNALSISVSVSFYAECRQFFKNPYAKIDDDINVRLNCERTHEHSAIDATHISFETSCLLQLNMAAFSGILYDLVRILRPLPQVTEHEDHGE